MATIGSGAEVIRGGQQYSTANVQKGDIVTKIITRSGGGGSSRNNGQSTVSQADLQASIDKSKKEKQEKQTRQDLANLSRNYNKDLRNIEGISGRTERLNQFREDRERITSGRPEIVAGGKRTSTAVVRDTKTGEIKITEQTIRGPGGSKTIIKKDYTSGTERIDTIGAGVGRTGSSYSKEVKEEPKVKTEEINAKDIILPKYESKFEQPTRSTRTDLTFEDVRPKKLDFEKEKQFIADKVEKITSISFGGVSVGQVLDKPIVTTPEFSIFQKSTLTDDGTPGQTSPRFESQQFTVGNLLATPVELARDIGKEAEKGVAGLAFFVEKIPGDIKSFGGTTVKTNIVESLRVIGQPVARFTPELVLFSQAPITTSVSGFAFEREQENLFGAGVFALLGGLSVGAKVIPSLKIPKGKKGQASLEQISKGRFEKLREALAKLEKQIASKKPGKEQTDFIKETRSKLPTEEAKTNFDKYIESLKEKEVVKVPTIKITSEDGQLVFDTNKLGSGEITVIETGKVKLPKPAKDFVQDSPFNTLDLQKQTNRLQIGTKIDLKEIEPQTKQLELLQVKTDIKSDIKTQQQIKILVDQDIKTKQKTAMKTAMDIKTDIKSDIKTKQKTTQKIKSMLDILQGTKQKTALEQVGITQTKPGLDRPRPPRIKVPKLFKEDTMKSKTVKDAEKVLNSFKVFVTKAGKDVEIGDFGTVKEAKKKLKGELSETLRAGGFVETKGKKVKIDLGFGFRPSKVTPGKVVQLKERRFGSKRETTEAQFFRKKKGGSKFL